jgi:polynucleotide 5'-kinase involved in rRNA processing
MSNKRKRPLQAENSGTLSRKNDLSAGKSGPRGDEGAPSNGGVVFKADDDASVSLGWKLEILPQENQSLLSYSPRRARLKISRSCLLCVEGRGRIRQLRQQPVDTSRTKECVSFHGYTLTDEYVEFESPRWNSLLTIEVSGATVELDFESLFDSAALAVGSSSGEEPLIRVFDATTCSASGPRITVIPGSWTSAVESILTSYEGRVQQRKLSSLENLQKVEVQVDEAHASRPFHWGFRVALAGAKATGKSTCLRYLVNRFLSCDSDSIRELFVLDADCGQPELSPPGLLTLTRVTSPMLQPPHTRSVQQYEHACFYGHTTSSVDPSSYVDCIRELLAAFDKAASTSVVEPILVINLDGWVKSVGEQILEALMGLLSPNHVIQLSGDSKSQQFRLDYLDCNRTKLHQAFSFNSKQEPSRGPVALKEPLIAGVEADSFRAVGPPSCLSLPASTWRAIRMCSYFVHDASFWSRIGIHQLKGIVDFDAEIGNRLAEAKPYQLSFDCVEWRGCFSTRDCGRGIRSESCMLDLLNGSVVGLCHLAPQQNDMSRPQLNYHLLPCVGLGLIRAIDYERRMFYILTPVPFDTLRSVNCLVRGSLRLPIECLFRGVQSDDFSYQSFDTSGPWGDNTSACQVLGEYPMQSRGNIGRRSLHESALGPH